MTDSYRMAFILGGVLVVFSGIVMVQPYCYTKHHADPDAIDTIVEKAALSDDNENILRMSHRDLVQMAVSLESLNAAKRALDIQKMTIMSTTSLNATKPLKLLERKLNGKSYLPVHKELQAVKCTYSTETI